jgi:hypothetical protein
MTALFFELFFARFAALRPSKPKTPACWEQLRAGLRRKEVFWRQPLRHEFAAAAYSFKLSKTLFARLVSAGTSNP